MPYDWAGERFLAFAGPPVNQDTASEPEEIEEGSGTSGAADILGEQKQRSELALQ